MFLSCFYVTIIQTLVQKQSARNNNMFAVIRRREVVFFFFYYAYNTCVHDRPVNV